MHPVFLFLHRFVLKKKTKRCQQKQRATRSILFFFRIGKPRKKTIILFSYVASSFSLKPFDLCLHCSPFKENQPKEKQKKTKEKP